MARNLQNTPEDRSQRMLNAIEPCTELPIHRHWKSTKTSIVLRGTAEDIFYDDRGKVTESILMTPNSDCCGINIEKGRWHKIVSLESGTVIYESKMAPMNQYRTMIF